MNSSYLTTGERIVNCCDPSRQRVQAAECGLEVFRELRMDGDYNELVTRTRGC